MTNEQTTLPNWTGLLNWSTKFHDGTQRSQFSSLDPERREWLERALQSAYGGGESPQKIMTKAIDEISEGRVSAGLDLLDYVSDFPDCAEDIDKRGALKPLIALISSPESGVIIRALEVLTLYLPNNPRVQLAAALRYEMMQKLRICIRTHATEPTVIHSGLSVMGATIRNVVPLENSFVKDGGCEFIVEIGSTSNDKSVVQKVCSILVSLKERHSLTENSDSISKMLERIYSSDIFDRSDIQFWEIIASLCSKSNVEEKNLLRLIAQRLEWIGDQAEYDSEREILVISKQ